MTSLLTARARLGPQAYALEAARCAVLTAAVAALLLAFGPAPGDAAVHLYRTFLVRTGALLWDNFWYEGNYPLASYSLLYYFPAAVVGNLALALAASVASTVLFASILRREWGEAAVWPSRVFAVCAAAPLFTGLYSYSLAFAVMLGTLRALQSRRIFVACVLSALTLGLSPLAFVFLCLVLASIFAARRRMTSSAVVIGTAIALLAVFELALLGLFPAKGIYPFHPVDAAALLSVCGLGFVLARRARADVIAAFFALWGIGGCVVALVASPIGGNWTRLSEFVFPLMLLVAVRAQFRPRRLVVLALAASLAYNLVPYLLLIPYRLDNRPAAQSFWRPALGYLQMHARKGFRVEVVPTAAHWESYWLARNGFALARGWYRQLDVVDNPVLYERDVDARAYRDWLRSVAVEYVLLPSTRLDFVAAPAEARLLRSGRSGLEVVFRNRDWLIYRLPQATPLLTGPGSTRILEFDHTTITGVVSAPGTYLLRTHFVPFWRVHGAVCVRAAPRRMTLVEAAAPGRFTVTIGSTGDAVLRAVTGGDACAGRGRELAGEQLP